MRYFAYRSSEKAILRLLEQAVERGRIIGNLRAASKSSAIHYEVTDDR